MNKFHKMNKWTKSFKNNQINKMTVSIKKIKNIEIFNRKIFQWQSVMGQHFKKYSMFYILTFIVTIFAIMTKAQNLTSENLINVIESNSYIFIIGLGMLLVIIAGYIDLSVGALMGFMGVISVQIYNNTGGSIFVTILLVSIIGAGIGLCQGVLIGYFKIPAFIVTLAGMLLFQGLVLYITKGKSLTPIGEYNSSYIQWIIGSMPDIIVGKTHIFALLIFIIFSILVGLLFVKGRYSKKKYGIYTESIYIFIFKILFIIAAFITFGVLMSRSVDGLKYYVIYIIILIIFFIFITQFTTFGRSIYAIGGNKKAAELSGVNSRLITTFIFMIIGSLTGFAGVVYTAVQNTATAQASNNGYELDVISSVFVGGASMTGGIGTVANTIIGGFILGFINNGMLLKNYGIESQQIIKALVLLTAVGYDVYANRKIG